MSHRKRLTIALVAAAGAAAVWTLRHDSGPRSDSRPSATASPRVATKAPARKPPGFTAPDVESSVARHDPIVAITLDKTEVCRGELNFANVEATTPDGMDAHLYISLPGFDEAGPRLPFRLDAPVDAAAMPRVVVHGHGLARTAARLPPVKVKDCDVDGRLEIRYEALERGEATYRFSAAIAPTPTGASSKLPERATVTWTFGDGAVRTSDGASIVHSFEDRAQATRFSYFLITATVADARGRKLGGARTLEFFNPAFHARVHDNKVLILASAQGDDGGVTRVRLRHAYERPVHIETVTVTPRRADGSDAGPAQQRRPADLFGFSTLEPHAARTFVPRAEAVAGAAALVYHVSGRSVDGLVAEAVFSVVLGPRGDATL